MWVEFSKMMCRNKIYSLRTQKSCRFRGGVVFTNEVVLGAWREFWMGLPPLFRILARHGVAQSRGYI